MLFSRILSACKSATGSRIGFLANIKIAPKILAGFLIITLLSTGMGLYAVNSLQKVSDASQHMYEGILLPTRNMAEIQDTFQKTRVALRQLLFAENDSQAFANKSIISNNMSRLSLRIPLVEQAITRKDDVENLKQSFASYEQMMAQTLERFDKGDTQGIMLDLNQNSQMYGAELMLESSINELQTVIIEDSTRINNENISTAQNVLSFMTFAIIFVLLLCVLIGVLMSRSISGPVKKLTANARLLAAGEMNITVSDKVSHDEIGQMEESFKTIVTTIKDLTDDINMLIAGVLAGSFTMRADESKHNGAYRQIIEGFNTTLGAMLLPINESADVLHELSKGNLSVSVEGEFEGDFAIIKDALNGTIKTLKGYIDEITRVLSDIAKGVLTVSIETEFKGDFIALKESINQSIGAFNGVLGNINLASEEVAMGAAQLSKGSQTISQDATEQASSLEQLTASVSSIAEQTKNNARSADQASSISQTAKSDAVTGNEKMKVLQKAMQEINTSSANISKIIKVIDDIAFQTNILALNAAVEAARAGVHGKGFAVVAEEVRNLSARSAKAAQKTTDLIEGSIHTIEAGTKIADETAKALSDIMEGVEQTVAISGQIAAASNEQATGIVQINKGIEQLSKVVQNNSAIAQEAAASSQELAAQAQQLKYMVGRFQLKDQQPDISHADDTPDDDSQDEAAYATEQPETAADMQIE